MRGRRGEVGVVILAFWADTVRGSSSTGARHQAGSELTWHQVPTLLPPLTVSAMNASSTGSHLLPPTSERPESDGVPYPVDFRNTVLPLRSRRPAHQVG